MKRKERQYLCAEIMWCTSFARACNTAWASRSFSSWAFVLNTSLSRRQFSINSFHPWCQGWCYLHGVQEHVRLGKIIFSHASSWGILYPVSQDARDELPWLLRARAYELLSSSVSFCGNVSNSLGQPIITYWIIPHLLLCFKPCASPVQGHAPQRTPCLIFCGIQFSRILRISEQKEGSSAKLRHACFQMPIRETLSVLWVRGQDYRIFSWFNAFCEYGKVSFGSDFSAKRCY